MNKTPQHKAALLNEATDLGSLQKQLDAEKRRSSHLAKQVEQLQERLDKLAATKFSIPTAKPTKAGRGAFVRAIIPDTHGSHVDPQAFAACMGDLAAIQPTEVVMLGDHIDCGGFLAQHHTWGYVAETDYTFEQDIVATNAQLDEIQKAAPAATVYYLEGNHERRIERWCVTQALRGRVDASHLLRLFGVESQLYLVKRGVRHFKQGVRYDNLPVPSAIKLGKCVFTHGEYTGPNAARRHVEKYGANVVFGHVHTIQQHTVRTVSQGVICGWSVGCLCVLQPAWMHSAITNWAHGYAIQWVRPNGEFLHATIPIIDGQSFLGPMIEALGGKA